MYKNVPKCPTTIAILILGNRNHFLFTPSRGAKASLFWCLKDDKWREKMKEITIGTKKFAMKSSAYTQFKYKDITGRSLIKDLTMLGKKYADIGEIKEEEALEKYDDLEEFIMAALRMAYIMSMEGKSFNGTFENFLMEIDNYLDNLDWISEVMDLALSPLSRNIQTN
jgi:hypothetical protein